MDESESFDGIQTFYKTVLLAGFCLKSLRQTFYSVGFIKWNILMSLKALQKISMEVQKIATAQQLAICPHDEKEVSPVWPASFYFCKKCKREKDNKKCQHPL